MPVENAELESSVVDLEKSDVATVHEAYQTTKPRTSRLQFSAAAVFSVIVFVGIFVVLFVLRHEAKSVLEWVERQPRRVSWLLFILLFTAVSLPMTWGYLVLNVSAGYLYGVVNGFLVTAVSGMIGVAVSHVATRTCLRGCVSGLLDRPATTSHALLGLLSGRTGVRVVIWARLTPIPFGLQNAAFALSPMRILPYLAATGIGLMPTQILNAYLGSTLRSMEDVLEDEKNATTGYIIFSVQVVISILLMCFIVRHARRELDKSILNVPQEEKSLSNGTLKSSANHPLVNVPPSNHSIPL